jgi:hypothetical protein
MSKDDSLIGLVVVVFCLLSLVEEGLIEVKNTYLIHISDRR